MVYHYIMLNQGDSLKAECNVHLNKCMTSTDIYKSEETLPVIAL